jgi:hypothetical protein
MSRRNKWLLSALIVLILLSFSCDLENPSGGKSNTIHVRDVQIHEDDPVNILVGAAKTLTPIITPFDATDPSVLWKSDNEDVATVNSQGTVRGVAVGNAVITVTTRDGNHRDTRNVYVRAEAVAVKGVEIQPDRVTLSVGKMETLRPVFMPDSATNREVEWKSEHEAIATVLQTGVVRGIAVGTTAITVTTKDGNRSASCIVTVVPDTTAVIFQSVIADGHSAQSTTALILNFSDQITSLNASDITLTGGGVTIIKGALTGSNPYTLPISGFNARATLSVTVSKTGYAIEGSPKTVDIHYVAPVVPVYGISLNGGGGGGRNVVIEMFDSAGDGWDHNGALRVSVNGVNLSPNVRIDSGSSSTRIFSVSSGDIVQFYWTGDSGQYHSENSFIVYYQDTPPSPLFTSSNNNSWNGQNALLVKLLGSLSSSNINQLLGSFTASGGGGGGILTSHTFPGATQGYGAQTPLTVTVQNTGDQATGALSIARSGTNPDSFTLSASSLTSIAVGGSRTFTVVPNTGLSSGTYTATITVTGGNNISAHFYLSFTVTGGVTPTYGISLSGGGIPSHTFPGATQGYGAQTPLTVTVQNTGNQATGALSITRSGTNSGSFTLSASSLTSIAVGGSGTFTVAPNTGLSSGTYAATITVSGGNGISAQFNLSFTVTGSSSRTVVIDMFDSYGDGWDHGGALRINVNGTNLSNNARLVDGYSGTYTFTVSSGDIVQFYWTGNTGGNHYENSFIVYYQDTPPSPAFTSNNNNSWNGQNALLVRLHNSLSNSNLNQLLGSFTASGASSRTVVIDMFDSYGDGWDNGGALRISVNGTYLSNNARLADGYSGNYTFTVSSGDIVQFYWTGGAGGAQGENSFIVYYQSTPPSPAFTSNNNSSWNGQNALLVRLRGTIDDSNINQLLGSFTASG